MVDIEKKLLEIDYCLSVWLSYNSDRVVPGTIFLYLSKLSYLSAALFCFILSLLPFKVNKELAVGLIVLIILIIMYAFKKEYTNKIYRLKLPELYKKLGKGKIRIYRFLALSLLILSIAFCFIIAILTIEGYSVRIK